LDYYEMLAHTALRMLAGGDRGWLDLLPSDRHNFKAAFEFARSESGEGSIVAVRLSGVLETLDALH
jgi:hypothetical protein